MRVFVDFRTCFHILLFVNCAIVLINQWLMVDCYFIYWENGEQYSLKILSDIHSLLINSSNIYIEIKKKNVGLGKPLTFFELNLSSE